MTTNQPSVVTLHQRLDTAIALAESQTNPSDEDNDKLLNLYLEQRTLRAAIQALMEKETVGGPATVSFTHRLLQSAEEILVVGRGFEVAHVVVDAFGPAGRGNGVANFAISKVGRTMLLSLQFIHVNGLQLTHGHQRSNWFIDKDAASKIGNARAFQ